jgi:KDO2-lipid IV(A) lauroyltransferase
MDKERKRKILRQNLGWAFARTFAFLNGILSLKLNYALGKFLGSIAYLVVGRHRKISVDNLAVAFPQKSLRERKKITRNFLIFMAQGSFELLHILKNPSKLENVRIQGKDNLDKALENKKGVIILTAHMGNFPLMSLKLAKLGYIVHFVTRPMRDKKISEYTYNLRTRAGVRTIFSYPRRECVNGIIQALGNNESVIMQMDQNFGTGGVWVKFFGKLAATPVGPIVLALRTKASIVPAFIYREKNNKHCIKILPEEKLIQTPDKSETVLLNAIKFTRIIEGWIKDYACQWGWIHRRWKSRPSPTVERMKFKIER